MLATEKLSGEPGGVSPRILFNYNPGAYATRLTKTSLYYRLMVDHIVYHIVNSGK